MNKFAEEINTQDKPLVSWVREYVAKYGGKYKNEETYAGKFYRQGIHRDTQRARNWGALLGIPFYKMSEKKVK